MFTSPNYLPSDSRIWIYQANRELKAEEVNKISLLAQDFINSWTAHNQELKGSFEIRHHIFLILMIDEKHASASGCSIDKSIHFVQKIEKDFSISLLDRQIFALREKDKINLVKRKEFEAMIKSGEITEDTIVFNNLIQSKGDLQTNWEIPVRESWHGAIR